MSEQNNEFNVIDLKEFTTRYESLPNGVTLTNEVQVVEGWIRQWWEKAGWTIFKIKLAGTGVNVVVSMNYLEGYRTRNAFSRRMQEFPTNTIVTVRGYPARSTAGVLGIIAIQMDKKRENVQKRQGETNCKPCGTSSKNQAHWTSPVHKCNLVKQKFASENHQVLANLGLELKIKNKTPGIEIIEEQETVKVTNEPGLIKVFEIQVRKQTGNHEHDYNLNGFSVPSNDVLQQMDNISTSKNKLLKSPFEIKLKTFHKNVGQFQIPLVLYLINEANKQIIKVPIKILVQIETSKLASIMLNRKEPKQNEPQYRHKINRNRNHKNMEEKEKKGPVLEYERKLKLYRISDEDRKIIESKIDQQITLNEQEKQKSKEHHDLLTAPITKENYVQKHQLSVNYETIYHENSLEQLDRYNVKIEPLPENKFKLHEHYLNSGRSKLRPGDQVLLLIERSTEHQLEVLEVNDTFVILHSPENAELCEAFDLHQNIDLVFTLDTWTDRMKHRAIELAATLGLLSETLFPQEIKSQDTSEDVEIKFYNQSVKNNQQQSSAVKSIVTRTSGNAPYIIFGPPGTGKTTVMVEAILQVWRIKDNAHILVATPSNTAADVIAERLCQIMSPKSMIRLYAKSTCPSDVPLNLEKYSNKKKHGSFDYPPIEALQQYQVIVSTLAGAGILASAKFSPTHFTHVFVDEAGQASEPESLIAMAGIISRKTLSIKGQIILGGDPKQLGPYQASNVYSLMGFDSLMERLMSTKLYEKSKDGYDKRVITKLVQNFRSHNFLLTQPSQLFYDGELIPCAPTSIVNACLDFSELGENKNPLLVHGTMGREINVKSSKLNPVEIIHVAEYASKLINEGFKEEDIGVITPYCAQLHQLRATLMEMGLKNITVGTVELFQGQEKKIIIISTVRSSQNPFLPHSKYKTGFLKNQKRTNVAITRPMALLIIVGNPLILRQITEWRSILDYAAKSNCYRGVKDYKKEENEDLQDLTDALLTKDQLKELKDSEWDPK